MRSCNNYQDIEDPEEENGKSELETLVESMLEDFDPEEAEANHCSYNNYVANCYRRASQIIERRQAELYD